MAHSTARKQSSLLKSGQLSGLQMGEKAFYLCFTSGLGSGSNTGSAACKVYVGNVSDFQAERRISILTVVIFSSLAKMIIFVALTAEIWVLSAVNSFSILVTAKSCDSGFVVSIKELVMPDKRSTTHLTYLESPFAVWIFKMKQKGKWELPNSAEVQREILVFAFMVFFLAFSLFLCYVLCAQCSQVIVSNALLWFFALQWQFYGWTNGGHETILGGNVSRKIIGPGNSVWRGASVCSRDFRERRTWWTGGMHAEKECKESGPGGHIIRMKFPHSDLVQNATGRQILFLNCLQSKQIRWCRT